MPNLQMLEVNKNKLQNIAYLSTIELTKLQVLNISCNAITDLEATTVVIVSLPALKALDAYENPIEQDYRYKFRMCENQMIGQLDGLTITEVTRKNFESARKETNVEAIIKGTTDEYAKRVESEKLRRDMVLKYMKRHEEEVNKKFDAFQENMNKY